MATSERGLVERLREMAALLKQESDDVARGGSKAWAEWLAKWSATAGEAEAVIGASSSLLPALVLMNDLAKGPAGGVTQEQKREAIAQADAAIESARAALIGRKRDG